MEGEKSRGGFTGRFAGQDAQMYHMLNGMTPAEDGISLPEMIAAQAKMTDMMEPLMRAAAAK